jgi:hypothetical protein
LAGIVIGSVGVLDDVTVTQTSAVWELRRANPKLGRRELYAAGLRIGRDHMSSSVNTLVMAYAGAALPLLLAYAASGRGLTDVLTAETVAQELVRTLVGSIGLVASVPITTILAALIAMQEHVPVPEPAPAPVRRKRKPPTQDDMPTEVIRLEGLGVSKTPKPAPQRPPTDANPRRRPPASPETQRGQISAPPETQHRQVPTPPERQSRRPPAPPDTQGRQASAPPDAQHRRAPIPPAGAVEEPPTRRYSGRFEAVEDPPDRGL